MDKKSQKAVKIVLYISILTSAIGGLLGAIFVDIPIAISIFFGVILGFFMPWVIALISYSIYAMSNPLVAFKDEVDKLNNK